MGEIVSKSFHDYPKGFGPDITNTQNKNWITKHAELTNLTVVECQRLWTRFQQLGCDDDGILHMNHIGSAGKFKEDILFRNLLLVMFGESQQLHFHTFLNAISWVTNADVDERSKAVFYFFTAGGSFGKELFAKILRRVYPDKDLDTLDQYTETVYKSATSDPSSGQSKLTFEDFMSVCNAFSGDQLEATLYFDIIPDEANQNPLPKKKETGTDKDPSHSSLVCEASIAELSAAMKSTRNYQLMFEALGFSQVQILRFEKKYEDNAIRIREMLKSWKQLQEEEATCSELRNALETVKPELAHLVYGLK